VHGSLAGLEAVVADLERRAVDEVVHGGDLALMGAQPAEVVDRIRELGWPGVVGNTDELLWRPESRDSEVARAPRIAAHVRRLFDDYAPATRELLGDDRLAWLRTLPEQYRVGDLVVVHATPGDLWRAPMPAAEEGELLAAYAECDARQVVYGHIHRPYVREVGDRTIANSGSVGLPWDGDPRPAYVLVEDEGQRVVRVDHDVEREARRLAASGYPDAERLSEMRRRGRFVPL
jgi:predicted phosphodiesterase